MIARDHKTNAMTTASLQAMGGWVWVVLDGVSDGGHGVCGAAPRMITDLHVQLLHHI